MRLASVAHDQTAGNTAGNTVELQGRQFCKTYLGLNLKCCSPVPNGRLCSWCASVVHIWWNRGALMQGKRAWGQLMQGSCTMLFPKQTLKKYTVQPSG